jgi:hypothetical protein
MFFDVCPRRLCSFSWHANLSREANQVFHGSIRARNVEQADITWASQTQDAGNHYLLLCDFIQCPFRYVANPELNPNAPTKRIITESDEIPAADISAPIIIISMLRKIKTKLKT